MKGNRLLYIGAIISVGLATLLSLLNPLIIRITIDSIIGEEPLEVSQRFINIINLSGGRENLRNNLWIIGLVLVFITLFRGIFLYFKGKWSAVASESIARNMREILYDHLQHLPYNYHVNSKTGDIIQRCTSDLDTIRRFLAIQLVEVGRAVFILVTVSYIMFSLNVKMTLISMAVVPVIFSFAVIFFMKIKRAFKLSDEAEADMSGVLQENLTGVRVVRAFAREAYEVEKFDKKNKKHKNLTYKLIYLLAWYWGSSDFMCLLQIGAVIVMGSYWAAQGTITLGTLVVFTTYEGMLLWPVRQMGRILTDMGKALVSLERIQEILNQEQEDFNENGLTPEIKGNIKLENVYFKYEGEEKPVINNISLEVEKGQTIAISGPTGSGKSSLMYLLTGLYDCQKGNIYLDGIDISKMNKKWLRKNVGLVLQEPFLYARSIKENIAISEKKVNESKIYDAAKTAAIHDVIQDFEDGYNTFVGERGVSLSGGQKQRIAIARTIINDSPILIFDDSLSAVDTETDAAIRKALNERNKDTTTFIISHRVTTLAEADVILVLDEGKIVQKGTHEELITQPGMYQRIWNMQNILEQEMEAETEDRELI